MSSSQTPKYAVGDLVWAKMKGFSPWPGKVVDPASANMRRPPGNYRYKSIQCVYFFGSNNFAWIQEDAIKPYVEFKDQNCKLNKSHAFKEAIEKIDEYIKKGGDLPVTVDGAPPADGKGIGGGGDTAEGNSAEDGKGMLLLKGNRCNKHSK